MKKEIYEEIYEYACPSKRMTREKLNAKKTDKKTRMGDIVESIMLVLIILIFSVPLLIYNTLFFIISSSLYILILLVNCIDKDPYSKLFLNCGASLLYLGTNWSYITFCIVKKDFQYSCIKELIIITISLIISYEIMVCINIALKKYTAKLKNKTTSTSSTYTTTATIGGGFIGGMIAKIISPHLSGSLKIWILIITSAILIAVSIFFFQKYLLYKILKNRKPSA